MGSYALGITPQNRPKYSSAEYRTRSQRNIIAADFPRPVSLPQVSATRRFRAFSGSNISSSSSTTDEQSYSKPFDPCIWGKHFLAYGDPSYIPTTANATARKEHETLKQEIRRTIAKIQNTPVTLVDKLYPLKERLRLIDVVQRLGVSRHFEKEISDVLRRVYLYEYDRLAESDGVVDVYTVATAFRLLRDQGLFVSPEIFEKFLDDDDNDGREWKETAFRDAEDVISVYEASFYDVEGEDILVRAREQAKTKLESILLSEENRNSLLHEKVRHVLSRPTRRNCERLVAVTAISAYKKEMSFGEALLKFAVHDFNIQQFEYQKELSAITRWWDESNWKEIVPFARQSIVASYFLSIVLLPEPHYHTARILFAKLNALFVLVDDMYDTHGYVTEEDLELFTDAFEKLDPNASPRLPPYMKAIINATNALYSETDRLNPGKPYILQYLKREMERVVRVYEVDMKWNRSKTVPTVAEYFDVATVAYGVSGGPCMFLAGMGGDVVTENCLVWFADDPVPDFVRAAVLVCRCLDDLSPEPNEAGNVTGVRCYVKGHGLTEEEARGKLTAFVEDSYRELNRGMLLQFNSSSSAGNLQIQAGGGHHRKTVPDPKSNSVPPYALLKVMYRYAQAGEVFLRDGDSYSVPQRLKEIVSSVLVEPQSLETSSASNELN